MEKFLREPHYESYSIRASLKKIYGVGRSKWNFSFTCLGLPITRSNYHFKRLGKSSLKRIGRYLDGVSWDIGEYLHSVEKEERSLLYKMGCYRNYRYKLGLPSNGQRTKSNAGTSKRRNKGTDTFRKYNKKQSLPIHKRGGVS